MNDDNKDDDNPWDDDDGGGRTLTTDGPSFELPSNIPSPITDPPPAAPAAAAPSPKPSVKETLVGLMPADFMASLPKAASPSAPKVPVAPPRPGAAAPGSSRQPVAPPASTRGPARAATRSAPDVPIVPPPVVLADDDLAELPGHHDDGPTMAVASPELATRQAFKPFVPPVSPMIDKDAETMAVAGDDPRLPRLSREIDETTRAVSREEIMRQQDAHVVVVGGDAIGDEATLAFAPGQLGLGLGRMPGDGGIGASLAEVLEHRDDAAPPPPHFPDAAPSGSSGHLHAAPQHGQGMYGGPGMQAPPPPSYRNPPQQGFDPMMPQAGQFPPGPQGAMQGPPQSNPMGWGPPPNAPTGYGQGMPQQGNMHGGQPPPVWAPQQPPPSKELRIAGVVITSQILLLVGVGVVCLAIFVTGIVLFVTTKF